MDTEKVNAPEQRRQNRARDRQQQPVTIRPARAQAAREIPHGVRALRARRSAGVCRICEDWASGTRSWSAGALGKLADFGRKTARAHKGARFLPPVPDANATEDLPQRAQRNAEKRLFFSAFLCALSG